MALVSCSAFDETIERPELPPLPCPDAPLVGFAGSYAFRDDDLEERETLSLRAAVGLHLCDEHEVGGWLVGSYSNRETDVDARKELWAGLHYRYHWYLRPETSLFLGPTVGASDFDDEDAGEGEFAYGDQAGARHWISDFAALSVTPTYVWSEYDREDGGDVREFVVYWGLVFVL